METGTRSGGLAEWVPMEVIALEISLEQRAHLRVTGTGMVKDQEMNFETSHVDKDRKND